MVGAQTTKHVSRTKKLILGVAGTTAAAVIGTAGVAAAQTAGNTGTLPTSKADCVNWQDFSFKNHGDCVSWWEHQQHGGNGYGNGNNNHVDTSVNLDVSGNNNIINIALNYVFGR
jgi:hypothetical protein